MGSKILMIDLGTVKVYVIAGDHNPPHVHVIYKNGEKETRITIKDQEIITNNGFKPKELRQIVEHVKENEDELLKTWNEFNS